MQIAKGSRGGIVVRVRRVRGKGGDIEPDDWEPLPWAPEACLESLNIAFGRVRVRTVKANRWYMARRVWKSRWSKILRLVMVIAVGVAAVFPVVELADGDVQVAKYGYAAIAIGAAMFALDRGFGITSGWMRYIAAGLVIESQIESNDVEWEGMMAALGNRQPTPEQVRECIAFLRKVTEEVHAVIRADTEKWSAEIGSTIDELDRAAASAKTRAIKEGA